MNHEFFMNVALEQARSAGARGEIPIGAILVNESGDILAQAGNAREELSDPTAHAEVLALRQAGLVTGDWRLTDCTMYVTLEPCPMCAGALVMSRVKRLVLGAWNDEYGATGSRWDLVRDRRLNHCIEVIPGILAQESQHLVKDFMKKQRN